MESTRYRNKERGSDEVDLGPDENMFHEIDNNESNDRKNIILLMVLYVLQGIPLGLAGSIPYLLSSRNVSYTDQATFSFVFWPFSLKLLWAPFVDSLYIYSFGRRKSWLVPTQYLIAFFMIVLSFQIADILGDDSSLTVNILKLTVIFFMLNFLAATQDIAVDGWALTILSKKNVGWASTCNSVGQTAGYFLGNVVFLALESPVFCDNYLRSEPTGKGLVTLGDFLYFWGIVFLVMTTLVMFLKKESAEVDASEGLKETYQTLLKIVKLPAVKSLLVILITGKVGFAAADAVTGLKLIEEGVPKEKLAMLAIPLIPIQIILPLIISKYTAGTQPLNIFLKAMPYRMLIGLWFMFFVWWTPAWKTSDGEYPLMYYVIIVITYAFHQVTLYCMFVAHMAFHAKISDPAIGGTYMTLLNTVTNLGGNWPSTLALWLVDKLTWKSCNNSSFGCDTAELSEKCLQDGGACITDVDGYYIESILCFVLGIIWFFWQRNNLKALQNLHSNSWKCNKDLQI